MNRAPLLALAGLALLAACSPTPPQPQETAEPPRAPVAVVAEPDPEELPPMLDGEGNELDPELADAVREKMAENAGTPDPSEDQDAAAEE